MDPLLLVFYPSIYTFIVAAVASYIALRVFGVTKKVGMKKWLVLPLALTLVNLVLILITNSQPFTTSWELLFVIDTVVFGSTIYSTSKFYWKLSQKDSIKYTITFLAIGFVLGSLLTSVILRSFPSR